MTGNPKPYTAYRPSGIPWLGDVPAHWGAFRLKVNVFDVVNLTDHRNADERYIALEHVESWTGKISEPQSDISFESQVKRFEAGDVLFGKLRPYLAKVAQPGNNGVCVGEFLVLRPRNGNLLTGYLERLLGSKPIIDAIDATTFGAKMPRADWHTIGNMVQPYPPPDEQAAIVRYLDHADECISRYVSAKERLIALLEEQRNAVIHQAITRGLDDNAPLKPSDIPWLGDVPAHWDVRRVRTVTEMRVSNVDKHTKDDEIPVRLCNYVDVYKNDRITDTIPFMPATASADEIAQFGLKLHDVLITKDSETWLDIGVPALVEHTAADLVCGYHVAILRSSRSSLDGRYLFRVLQNTTISSQFHVAANGVTRYGLSHESIKSVLFPVPPLDEQVAIVAHLDRATAGMNAAIDRAHCQIELMQEYRTRLIADVVTGKLDVRNFNNRILSA